LSIAPSKRRIVLSPAGLECDILYLVLYHGLHEA
jgi:hypothetical protein